MLTRFANWVNDKHNSANAWGLLFSFDFILSVIVTGLIMMTRNFSNFLFVELVFWMLGMLLVAFLLIGCFIFSVVTIISILFGDK